MSLIKTIRCCLFMAAAPAMAHHSFAGYEMDKTLTAEGVIRELRWGAPHSAAVFMITNSDGTTQEMTLTSAAPMAFVKQGILRTDLKVGEKVQVTWHPTRNGHPGGALAALTLPDGRQFKDTEIAGSVTNDVANQHRQVK